MGGQHVTLLQPRASADQGSQPGSRSAPSRPAVGYKWIALSNTTLGMLMATINSSITLIALPDIFRGIGVNPLAPGDVGYLLWMLMGFMVVTAVLVVAFGRIGDIFGRVRMYELGFAVFTLGSVLLSADWLNGAAGASYLIGMRVVQGLGAAMLMANSAAILTDAFPTNQRGLALGINNVAAISGSFIGLVLGGLLGPLDWRLVFLVSVPVRRRRHDLGLFEARGEGRPEARPDRLVGHCELCGRSRLVARRDHLWDPALWPRHHGLG